MVPALILAGCQKPQERARHALEKEGISFTTASYLKTVSEGNLKRTKLFLQAGMAVDAADAQGETALMHASAAGQKVVAEYLLKAKADPTSQDKQGRNALVYAIENGRIELASLLAATGATLNQADKKGRTPLSAAMDHSSPVFVKSLIDAGARPGPDGAQGQRFIVWAVASGNLELTRTLLQRGENPNETVRIPARATFIKTAGGDESLEYYLRREEGVTLLMIASAQGNLEMVELLLKMGANRRLETKGHETSAVYLAAVGKHAQVVQLLFGKSIRPEDQHFRVEISLSKQRATVFKDGQVWLKSPVSTGRKGFATPPGLYVVTDKYEDWVSTLYDAEMPFFMRLNCGMIGLHAGELPGYPASHGCIRMPYDKAKEIYDNIDPGTLVSIGN
ncbi:MAG: ankyrin repeat domain-containing protein [Methylacidiphilales bacterium]|nr:ankyrin repeat domain-containing protein [Candidatus Methylacidiphilales bacterium]